MSDNDTEGPDVSGEPHEWHMFDVEDDLEVCQVTEAGEPNRYLVRRTAAPDEVTELDAGEFAQLLEPGPNPKGL
jgi:hypothetical protein